MDTMISVVERSAILSGRVEALRHVEKAEYTTESLIPVLEKLEGIRNGLRKQRARAAAIGRGWPSNKAQAALVPLGKVRVQVERDPGLLVRGHTFSNLTDSLGALVRETRSEVDIALEQQRQIWTSISTEYLVLFSAIPDLRPICEEGIAIQRELIGGGGSWKAPEEPGDIRTLLRKGERLIHIKMEVDEFDCPDQVRSFLERAQTPGGAPWTMLVPATRTWLEEHNLLPKLRIRLG
jgi:hypothetical protein